MPLAAAASKCTVSSCVSSAEKKLETISKTALIKKVGPQVGSRQKSFGSGVKKDSCDARPKGKAQQRARQKP